MGFLKNFKEEYGEGRRWDFFKNMMRKKTEQFADMI